MNKDSTYSGDILIVDDDPYSRMWARRWLEQAKYTVREATNGRQALAEIGRYPPDLILLDVMLPDIDGFELTRQLRQNAALDTMPILVVTVLDDIESKVEGLEAGANDFMTKLPEKAELLARVRMHLRLKRNQEELLAEKDKTALLYRISRELSIELDLDSLLTQIIELTIASIGALHGSIILLGERGGILRCISTYEGQVTTVSDVVPGRIVQNGLAGWVIEHREGTILPDTTQDHRWVAVAETHAVTRSALAVPLIHQDHVVGVLTLTHEEADRFTPAHLDLLNSIAAQAAIALVNAQLFDDVEQERGQLETTLSRLAAILTGTADAILATDAHLHITLLNPAAEQVFGIPLAAAAGWPLAEILPYEALVGAFRQAQEEAGPAPPAELVLADGRTLFFTVSSVAAGPRSEGGWVAVMQDISHLKELDQLKNEFVSTVSHDLRTPLATIHGYAELLALEMEGENREMAQRIQADTMRLSNLVEELLDLGKIEAGVEMALAPCRLEQLVEEAIESARFPADTNEITLDTKIAPLSAPIWGNPTRLRQVLDNLIGNALKYTPTGGSVTVRAWEQNDQITVTIQDSGVGIPRELLPRIFEKFYRVPGQDNVSGAGLGLAIVKAIVDQHGGRIWVESEPGAGSTFGFSLPCTAEG